MGFYSHRECKSRVGVKSSLSALCRAIFGLQGDLRDRSYAAPAARDEGNLCSPDRDAGHQSVLAEVERRKPHPPASLRAEAWPRWNSAASVVKRSFRLVHSPQVVLAVDFDATRRSISVFARARCYVTEAEPLMRPLRRRVHSGWRAEGPVHERASE